MPHKVSNCCCNMKMTGSTHLQAGKGNVMDEGVKRYAAGMGVCAEVEAAWAKLDEVPFDFERRMLSVVLRPTDDLTSPPLLVCKVQLLLLLMLGFRS